MASSWLILSMFVLRMKSDTMISYKNEKPGDRYVDHVIIYLVKAVKHGSREGKNMLFQQLIRIGERETTF